MNKTACTKNSWSSTRPRVETISATLFGKRKVSQNSHAAEWLMNSRVPVVEMALQGKELAITHFVKSGTLQNACSEEG